MKLYNFTPAANALRVEMFLNEKSINLETIQVNVREDELFKEPYKSMNPFNCVPFLELEDGTIITETISICRYIEEKYPDPVLFGSNAKERALIDMWNRRIELDGFLPLLHSVRNKTSFFKGKVIPGTRNEISQSPEIVSRGIEMFKVLLDRIDPHLSMVTSAHPLFASQPSSGQTPDQAKPAYQGRYFPVFSVFWLLKPDRFVPNIRPWFI